MLTFGYVFVAFFLIEYKCFSKFECYTLTSTLLLKVLNLNYQRKIQPRVITIVKNQRL